MPLFIPVIAVLFGLFGVAHGADQQSARKREQALFHASLARLQLALFLKEAELADLCARLGEKNSQVLSLAACVNQLRGQINAFTSFAA